MIRLSISDYEKSLLVKERLENNQITYKEYVIYPPYWERYKGYRIAKNENGKLIPIYEPDEYQKNLIRNHDIDLYGISFLSEDVKKRQEIDESYRNYAKSNKIIMNQFHKFKRDRIVFFKDAKPIPSPFISSKELDYCYWFYSQKGLEEEFMYYYFKFLKEAEELQKQYGEGVYRIEENGIAKELNLYKFNGNQIVKEVKKL